MRPTRRDVLGAMTATAALAGCLDGDGSGNGGGDDGATPTSGGDEPTPTSTPMDTATPTDGAPTVQVASHPDLGDILVGPDGFTLYMFDRDTQGAGSSACSGGCADAWPPLTVDGDPASGEGVTAELTTFERESGGMQVAAAGWPLYYFDSDESPGDATGQGVSDAWWVVAPDGTPIRPMATATPTGTATPTETGSGGAGGY